jgi:protein-S-isoprenylcysteine O-methyltransferase Ste14
MTPPRATLEVWALWAVSWAIAALWSRRTVGRPAGVGGSAYYLPTFLGTALLFAPVMSGHRRRVAELVGDPLWRLPEPIRWIFFAATLASFAFAWWARLYLGPLWSGTITRKEGHRVVDSGPYRQVRHPIYTGIIAASFLLAIQLATLAALVGAAIMTLGWWMKARAEERFLNRELGQAYEDYRRRTPMLVPFFRPGR